MKIRWLGHACFALTSEAGTRIVCDPYDESTGYVMPTVEADFVTVSHSHFDHATVSAIGGQPVAVKERGDHKLKDVTAHAIPTYHDDVGGARRGPNLVFVFEIDGVRVCHLGDLGHSLTSLQKAEIGNVDVLLCPVGGTYTIDAQAALQVCGQLSPRLIIPMHYRTEALAFPLDVVDTFLGKIGGCRRTGTTTIEVKREDLPNLVRAVYVLDYR